MRRKSKLPTQPARRGTRGKWLCRQEGGRFLRETPLARLTRAELLAIVQHLQEDLHQLRTKH